MLTLQQIRHSRLENDYKEMIRLNRDIISWKPLRRSTTDYEEYGIDASDRPLYRDNNVVHLTIPDDYPMTAPRVIMVTKPAPFRPNWSTSAP